MMIISPRASLALCLVCCCCVHHTSAFVSSSKKQSSSSSTSSSTSTTALSVHHPHSSSPNSNNSNHNPRRRRRQHSWHADDDSVEELERARRELEQLLSDRDDDDDGDLVSPPSRDDDDGDESHNHNHRPLSSARRRRRLVELELLRSLEQSDGAVDELMHLWMRERPSAVHAVDCLEFLERDCADPRHAEMALRQIAQTHPDWAEPRSRLALLLLVEGRRDECLEQVRAVLHLKPWHFEALQMRVLLQLAAANNNPSGNNNGRNPNWAAALPHARRGLPPLAHAKRRRRWVRTAVRQAQEQLDQLERQAAQARHAAPVATLPDHGGESADGGDSATAAATAWQ